MRCATRCPEPPLAGLAGDGRRAAIVVEPPAFPYPGVQRDPRQEALAATIDELERCGISDERQTLVVAGGLGRRLGRRDLERLLSPPRARSFRGRIVVHDAESPELVPIAERGDGAIRIRPEILGTDLVVVGHRGRDRRRRRRRCTARVPATRRPCAQRQARTRCSRSPEARAGISRSRSRLPWHPGPALRGLARLRPPPLRRSAARLPRRRARDRARSAIGSPRALLGHARGTSGAPRSSTRTAGST